MTAPPLPPDDDVVTPVLDRRLVGRLARYVRPYAGLAAGAVACLALEGALQLVGPWLTQRVIDEALPARDLAFVRTAALLFASSLVLQFACSWGETMLTGLLGQNVMRDLRTELFARLQSLSVSYFDRHPAGRLITRVTSDVESLNELFTAGVVAGLGDLFALLAIAVMMWVTDWRLALAAFAVVPFVWLVSRVFQAKVRVAYREIRGRVARINGYLQERITGLRIVQLFGREAHERARFGGLNREHLDANLRSITYYALYFPAIEVLTTVALASLIVAAAGRTEAGTLTVGTVAAFLQLVRRFFQPLQDLSDKFNTLQQAMAASERIFTLLDTRPTVVGGTGTLPARDDGRRGVTVTFDDVWFAYDALPPADGAPAAPRAADAPPPHWILKGISFTVRPGETLALVGHTGAGKSTIVALLLRYYDVQRGRILVDGVDIRTLSLDALRARIGFVQQDIFLFAGDVAQNIRLSSGIDDTTMQRAAARVGADRIVARLPRGWAQELGERGASLSVGERQLLSFARALASDPDLLLLDEATSAVDSEREAEIQGALATLMAGRTTIAVAHRLSTIVEAHEILVMHHGVVAERGTHAALLARRGIYERLWRLQVGEGDMTTDTAPPSPPPNALAGSPGGA
ncbi:MAG: ABC transporter ATP-binding protein/permease [Gemmatimonadaceae bacterium]|nr:ABC transporter ATP-binding protein/permease [Gemmatimonadaceae bacterium]